jgi:hypothetical protein
MTKIPAYNTNSIEYLPKHRDVSNREIRGTDWTFVRLS